MLWGEDDTFGRWLQFACAIPLIGIGAAVEYYWWTSPSHGYWHGWYGAGGAGFLVIGVRCLWYAITGKDNINRDDF
jgi:hypothetical protein